MQNIPDVQDLIQKIAKLNFQNIISITNPEDVKNLAIVVVEAVVTEKCLILEIIVKGHVWVLNQSKKGIGNIISIKDQKNVKGNVIITRETPKDNARENAWKTINKKLKAKDIFPKLIKLNLMMKSAN